MSTRHAQEIRQFVRFSVVGVIQNGINIGIFALAVMGRVPFVVASALAAVFALAVSFSLNRRWTFPGKTDRTTMRATRFATIWISILILGLGCLAALVDLLHIAKVLAQTIVVISGAPLSYAAQRRWTFADTRHEAYLHDM